MSVISAMMSILGSILSDIMSVTVPGLDITFFQFVAFFFVITLAIALLRFILGLPMYAAKTKVHGDINRKVNPRKQTNNSHASDTVK